MPVFDRLLEAAGIERQDAHGRSLDIHALRHTTASRLARSGAPLAITQRILGHSDPKLTARVYTHLGAEDLRGVVEKAAGRWGSELGADRTPSPSFWPFALRQLSECRNPRTRGSLAGPARAHFPGGSGTAKLPVDSPLPDSAVVPP